jgi:hypothetical protein
MYCFSNNIDFGYDWQLAYNQLYALYSQMTSDYQRAVELEEGLTSKVERIRKENEELKGRKISNGF